MANKKMTNDQNAQGKERGAGTVARMSTMEHRQGGWDL